MGLILACLSRASSKPLLDPPLPLILPAAHTSLMWMRASSLPPVPGQAHSWVWELSRREFIWSLWSPQGSGLELRQSVNVHGIHKNKILEVPVLWTNRHFTFSCNIPVVAAFLKYHLQVYLETPVAGRSSSGFYLMCWFKKKATLCSGCSGYS